MTVEIRQASVADSTHLALLADAATRRLISWVWDMSTTPGQSRFEVGREAIRADEASTSHHRRWRVAESDGHVAGGLNSYVLVPADHSGLPPEVERVVRPVDELKAIAESTWYVSVASVFPEFRGQGIGHALLEEADRCARSAECGVVTLLVHSFNPGAHGLYTRLGFSEWERREFVPFDGSDRDGHWILMRRAVDRA